MIRHSFPAVWLLGFALSVMLPGCGGGGGSGGGGGTSGGGSSGTTGGTASYTIGGSISGLTGTGLVLMNNGTALPISASGPFTFPTPVPNGTGYNVAVSAQPMGQTCTVASGTGTVNGANVTNVSVTCSATTYTIGGSVNGLAAGAAVMLQTNGSGVTVNANGTFTFPTPLANGTPYNVTVSSQPAGQACTVTGGTGTISGANVTNVSVACSTVATYTIGGTVSGLAGIGLVLQDNGGDNLTITAGGLFTFPTPLANGATYNVTVLNPPSNPVQSCTVTGGTGAVAGANVGNIAVNCVTYLPRYAFVANSTDNSVSSYVTHAATGRLKYIARAPAGLGPGFIAVDRSGMYAYVVNKTNGPGGNSISQFTIGTNGVLTPMATPTVATGMSPQSMAIHPSGLFAYVVNAVDYTVSEYGVGAGGALTLLGTVATGAVPSSVTIEPYGKYLYVGNQTSGDISAYSIGANGVLTQISCGPAGTPGCSGTLLPTTFAGGGSPVSLAVHPSGKFLYAANSVNSFINQYAIGANGALTLLATATAGTAPASIAVDPAGRYAYVANSGGLSVSQFTIGANGVLAPMGTPAVAAGTTPQSVTVDASGKYVFVANLGDNTVSQYTIGATGALTPNAPSIAAAQLGPVSVALTRGVSAVQAVPLNAYVTNLPNGPSGNSVSQFTIGAGGGIVPLNPAVVALGATFPYFATIDPAGKSLFTANCGGSVSSAAIGTGGALAAPSVILAATCPLSVAFHPSGRYAYVLQTSATTTNNAILGYAITNGTWGATFFTSMAGYTQPNALAMDPSGRYLYVPDQKANAVVAHTIGATGAIAALGSTATGINPTFAVVDPSGRYLYVANNTAPGTLSEYTIGANGGITLLATAAAGSGPTRIAIDPSGTYVYATNSGSNDVSAYSIGPTGVLTQISCGAPGTAGCSGAVGPTSFSAGAFPVGVNVDPSGKYLYVANQVSQDVSAYSIAATGALTQISCGVPGTAGCTGVATPTNFAAAPNAYTVVTAGTWQ